MTKRSIKSVVFLSMCTLGVFNIYWYYKTSKEFAQVTAREQIPALGNIWLAIFFSIITLGVYGLIWAYQFYKISDRIFGAERRAVLTIIHAFLITNFINIAIIQSEMNYYNEKCPVITN